MQTKREYRDRDETEVAVLDTLVDRTDEGMTVFELRTGVDVDIDELETALADLKDAGLITVENSEGPMRIYPDDRVIPESDPAEPRDAGSSIFQRIRKRIGL